VDNPRNWYLDSFDLNSIGNFAKEIGATFIVDTSVQPLQPTALSAADIVVLSLSKYPSLGFSMGGAILSNKSGGILFENIKHFSARNAYMLSAESAFSINGQIISLRDRMEAVSAKAWAIHTFLESCDMVKKVRIPNKLNLDGFCGGQVSFHLINPDQGRKIEELVGTNSLGHFSLHLACTFGASFTTIEHLNSNPRKREGFLGIQSNEQNIPNDILRIGVGCESIQEIISDLEFVLRATE
jgi:cystathionine beta-lyase/cystathionine gamma-synthase